jgi:hypothetical protein
MTPKPLYCITCDHQFEETDIPRDAIEVDDHDGIRTFLFPDRTSHSLRHISAALGVKKTTASKNNEIQDGEPVSKE